MGAETRQEKRRGKGVADRRRVEASRRVIPRQITVLRDVVYVTFLSRRVFETSLDVLGPIAQLAEQLTLNQ